MVTLTLGAFTALDDDLRQLERSDALYGAGLPLSPVASALEALRPPVIDGAVRMQMIDMRKLLTFLFQYPGSDRYTRDEQDKILQAASVILTIYATDEKAGGVARLLGHPRYKVYAVQAGPVVPEGPADIIARGTLVMDFVPTGKEAALPTPSNAAGINYGSRNPYTVPDAWPDWLYAATIVPCNADGTPATTVETHPVCLLWLNKTKRAGLCPWMALQTSSYDWTHVGNFSGDGGADGRAFHSWQVLPTSLAVTHPRPLLRPPAVPFSDLLSIRDIHRHMIVPHWAGNGSRPTFAADGRVLTEQRQGYMPQDRRVFEPLHAMLDGPRNVATSYLPTWIRVGHAGGCYVGSPWNLAHFLADDTRVTLIGWYHVKAPTVKEAADGTTPHKRLAGDWSLVPIADRVMYRVEGFCFNEDDIVRGAETNTHINGDPVHNGRVRVYWICGNGALYCGSARGDDPNRGTALAEPYIVTMMTLPGTFLDGWGPAFYKGVLYIPERGRHRIVMRDANTGADLGVWSDGGVAATTLLRFEDEGVKPGIAAFFRCLRRTGVTSDRVRALDCAGPECLRLLEDSTGTPYMFWGGLATDCRVWQQRLDRSTPRVAYADFPKSNAGKDHFTYFDIDAIAYRTGVGTFGPAGTVAGTTFNDDHNGWPVLFYPSPGVSKIDGAPLSCSMSYRYSDRYDARYAPSGGYNAASGRGGIYDRAVYGMAPGIGFGALISAGTPEGLYRWTKARPDDPFPDYKRLDAGGVKYQKAALRDYWGIGGYSKFDDVALPLPEPWASDPDVRYYLDWWARA